MSVNGLLKRMRRAILRHVFVSRRVYEWRYSTDKEFPSISPTVVHTKETARMWNNGMFVDKRKEQAADKVLAAGYVRGFWLARQLARKYGGKVEYFKVLDVSA